MKKRLLALLVSLGTFLGCLFYNANAGFEPSPFQPEINQLYAISNILHSADYRVGKSIAHPPDPCVPPDPCNSPDLNGTVNRLEAINKQVSSADDMVASMINEVMGTEPSPFREDLIPALEVVHDAAGLIDERISVFISSEPPLPYEYLDALVGVAGKASDVVKTAEWGIDELEVTCPCFADAQWSRIWDEWPAVGVPNQCAEFPSNYSFELGHWVFGNDKPREFIAVLDAPNPTVCRAQYGDPFSTNDVTLPSEWVQFCVAMMRAKATEAGVECF